MVVAAPKIFDMSGWTSQKRHCMHVLATHYPDSNWPDRAAIFNVVCNERRTANQVRDEYGGHKSGRFVAGQKQTRSKMWNDEICRDEFGLPGPFNPQQQIDRGTVLLDIQTAINTLGLSGHTGLGAVSLVTGMDLANVALANSNTGGIVAAVAPAPVVVPAAPLAGPGTTTVVSQAGTTTTTTAAAGPSASANNDESDNDESENGSANDESEDEEIVNAGEGGAAWYHSWEIKREGGRSGAFVYREISGLPYDEQNPPPTFPRRVKFPAMAMQEFVVRVCAVGSCHICGERQGDRGEEEEDEEGEEGEENRVGEEREEDE